MKNFFTKKKLIALGVLVAGVLGAVYIVGATDLSGRYLVRVAGSNASSTNPQLDFTVNPLPNLTNEFTDQALAKLMTENQNNSGNVADAQTLPSEADTDQIVGNIIDTELANEKPDISQVHQSTDDSKEMRIAYLIAIDQIIQQSTGDASSTPDNSTPVDVYFQTVGNGFQSTADLLKAMNVPPSWADIQAQLIAFYTAQADIYTSLGAGANDPLRFMIALERMPNEAEQNFTPIMDAINQRIKDQNLE